MCGIFSLLNYNNYDMNFIKEQFLKGQSRGPEDTKISTFDNNILMGFHRLAINGLNNESNQPLDINDIVVIFIPCSHIQKKIC